MNNARTNYQSTWLAVVVILATGTSGYAQQDSTGSNAQAPSQSNANQTRTGQTNTSQSVTPSPGRQTMELTPGQPLVTLALEAPAEIRLGRSFDYTIHVQNNSRNVMLHNIIILQHASSAFEIESSQIHSQAIASDQSTSNEPTSNQTAANQTTGNQTASTSTGQPSSRQPADQAATNASAATADGSGASEQQPAETNEEGTRWRIERLGPGQISQIRVSASSDAEGAGNVCVAIESYSPALCLTTRFVKPELEIAKQAPEMADICQEIPFEYLITNAGSGDLEQFTVTDNLPEGLATIDGRQQLAFALEDGLKAGATRKFVARLRADRTGQFFSRAMVEGPDGVSARSNRAGTQVVQPELAIDIAGPQALQAGALANYVVRVTNHGDAPAPSTRLAVYFPRSADLLRSGQPRSSNQAVNAQATNQPNTQAPNTQAPNTQAPNTQAPNPQEPPGQNSPNTNPPNANDPNVNDPNSQDQPANAGANQRANQQANQQIDNPNQQTTDSSRQAATANFSEGSQPAEASESAQLARQQMGSGSWDLGTIAPGQTVEVSYVLRLHQGGAIEQQAVAQYVCAHDQARAQAAVEDRITTQVLALTGLRLTVIDDQDPVPTGQQVTYSITLLNQGNAAARNVQVGATLPEGLEFVSADGQSTGQHAEKQVTFEPLPTLDPQAEATWKIVATVGENIQQKDQQSLKVTLDSDDLDETVESEEPTTLFQVENQNAAPVAP